MKKLLSLIILLMLVSSLAFATNKEYRLDEISRCKKDGHLKCDVEDNLVNGIVKEFNKDGSLTSEISYKEGMLNGISKNYDNKGNLWIERNYKNGEKDGPEKMYHKGKLTREDTYKNGVQHGIVKIYKVDGSWSETLYQNGKAVGEEKRFYPNDLVSFDGKLMKSEDAANALSHKMYRFTPIKIDTMEIADVRVPAVVVDSETIEIRIGVNADKDNLRLEIWDPNGNHSSPDKLGRYMTYTNNPAMEGNNGSQFYQVKAPTKGPWGLGLINEDKTKSVNCKYYAIAESGISFDSKISKNRVVPNEKFDFLATLKRQGAPVSEAIVEVVIQGWEKRWRETLFDDGQHNDGQANDGIYGNSLSFDEKGRYGVTFYVEGTAKMGDAFYRQSLEEFFFVE